MCLVVNTSAAWVRYLAREYDEAIDRCRYTLDLSPQFAPARRVIAASLLQLGRLDAAVLELEAVSQATADPVTRAWLAHLLGAQGAAERAGKIVSRLEQDAASSYVSRYHLALAQVGLGDTSAALESLRAAWAARDPAFIGMALEPRFEPLRCHPRYRALVRRLGVHNGRH